MVGAAPGREWAAIPTAVEFMAPIERDEKTRFE
jgi:hypothetical protein